MDRQTSESYLAEEMTTECWSEVRILDRWAATESSYVRICWTWITGNCSQNRCKLDTAASIEKKNTLECHLMLPRSRRCSPRSPLRQSADAESWSRRPWCSTCSRETQPAVRCLTTFTVCVSHQSQRRPATCLTSWCWLSPTSPESAAAECRRRRRTPSPELWPDRSRSPEEELPTDTTATKQVFYCAWIALGGSSDAAVICNQGHGLYLFVQRESVDLRQNPANTTVPSTHQDPEGVELLEQTQAGRETHVMFTTRTCSYQALCQSSIKHSRIVWVAHMALNG